MRPDVDVTAAHRASGARLPTGLGMARAVSRRNAGCADQGRMPSGRAAGSVLDLGKRIIVRSLAVLEH
jgi:hypothetical protein